ncbi:hypothetical protein HEO02_020640, partial [Escherichia coli]|nr:hypothetical protein [Escherichia coli]
MALTTISPHDAQELIARGAKLIDIRDADEYLREHIPEADLAPLSVLEQSGLPAKEGANKRGNTSRLTQSF